MIFSVFSLPFLWIFKAFVLVKLWGWFIVPGLGVPTLSMITAVAISMITGLLTYRGKGSQRLNQKFGTILIKRITGLEDEILREMIGKEVFCICHRSFPLLWHYFSAWMDTYIFYVVPR